MLRLALSGLVFLGSFFLPWYLMQFHVMFPAANAASVASWAASPSYLYTNTSDSTIFVTAPKLGESVTGTIILTGFARGNWFFEATFPIEVKNKDGIVLGQGQGKAQGEWMTTKLVPFTAEVDLKSLYAGPATITLKKDNPSGDPSRDASVSFPVVIQ